MKIKIPHLKALQEAADKASRHLLDHEGRIIAYKQQEAAIRQELASSLSGLSGPARQKTQEIFDQELDTRIRALRKATEKHRWEKSAEIQTIRSSASEVREYLTNPIIVASTYGVGTPERNAFEATLEGLGPATIANMALKARLENNKHLAAACIRANALLAANARQFDSKELAQELFGDETEKAKVLFRAIELALDKSIHQARDSDGKPMSPTTQLQMGMKHGPGTKMIPDEESEETESAGLTPLQQLNQGLNAA